MSGELISAHESPKNAAGGASRLEENPQRREPVGGRSVGDLRFGVHRDSQVFKMASLGGNSHRMVGNAEDRLVCLAGVNPWAGE